MTSRGFDFTDAHLLEEGQLTQLIFAIHPNEKIFDHYRDQKQLTQTFWCFSDAQTQKSEPLIIMSPSATNFYEPKPS
jgi:hypothetical protein